MKNCLTTTLSALASLAIGLTALPSANAADLGEIETDLDGFNKDIKSANADAAANLPGTRTKQNFENKLDKAERALDDAQANLDRVNDNEKSTDRAKKAATTKRDSAKKARDKSMKQADGVQSRFPDKDKAYRKALAEKREARAGIKKHLPDIQRRISSLNRKEAERIMRKARRALKDAESLPTWKMSTDIKTTSLQDTETGHNVSVLAGGNARNATKIATKANGNHKPCH